MPDYAYIRADTLTRVAREQLEQAAPGWGGIATDRPCFAIVDAATLKVPADWPLIDSEQEARDVTQSFNAPDDDGGGASERLWQSRMAGNMDC